MDLDRSVSKYPNQRLVLTLPLPVSVNHMYQNTRGGGKRLTSTAEQWLKTAQYITNRELSRRNWVTEACSVWYVMELDFYFPDKRKRDSHNYLKLLLDALQGMLYVNDYYVQPRIMYVGLDKDNPRVEVKLFMDKQYDTGGDKMAKMSDKEMMMKEKEMAKQKEAMMKDKKGKSTKKGC